MWTKLFGLAAAAGVVALCGTAPAFAVCNPGTPNCIRADSPWLTNAKKQVNQGNGNFNCDPGPGGVCSDDLPGSARMTTTHVMPPASAGMIAVAPRTRR
jgi:hypothetical protein